MKHARLPLKQKILRMAVNGCILVDVGFGTIFSYEIKQTVGIRAGVVNNCNIQNKSFRKAGPAKTDKKHG